jgi:hypothetical protein
MRDARQNHNVVAGNVEQAVRVGQGVQASDAAVDKGPIHEN